MNIIGYILNMNILENNILEIICYYIYILLYLIINDCK